MKTGTCFDKKPEVYKLAMLEGLGFPRGKAGNVFKPCSNYNLIFKLKGLDVSKSREGRDSPDPVEMGKPNLGKLENVHQTKNSVKDDGKL